MPKLSPVAPSGAVTGLDVSEPMLAVARGRTRDAAAPVRIVGGDAEVCDLPAATFDLVYSRFGVMFFADPEAAFVNLGGALKPGGRFFIDTMNHDNLMTRFSESDWVELPEGGLRLERDRAGVRIGPLPDADPAQGPC